MCAINGFTWADEGLGRKMNAVTAHRGPDATAVWSSEGVTFGHNRLAIIDLDPRSSQPMKSADGSLTIVYNGELYNYRELKKELSYPWRTESDTEVILAAYQKWGREALKKFNGIFALAIWDSTKQELLLARDPMGIKPLYYFDDGKRLIFSSEMKAILEHDVPRSIDPEARDLLFTLLYVPGPYSLIKGIKKFPPASSGVWRAGKLTIDRYWSLPDSVGSALVSPEEVKETLEEAVAKELISDRPVGLYLSGGIDSSVLLACMKKANRQVETFSVGYELEEHEQGDKFNADFDLAERTAKFFGSNHHKIFLKPDNLPELFERAIWHLDEPTGNATIIPQLVLAHESKKDITVALAGDGGDELFGGYERYRKYRRTLALLHSLGLISPTFEFEKFMFQKDSPINSTFAREFVAQNFLTNKRAKIYGSNFAELTMRVDRETWLIDDALMRTDKINMAEAVEVRVPFLNKDVVELAARIPLEQKLEPTSKAILREAFKKDLPDFVLREPKRGFFSPAAKWLRRPEFQTMARDLLRDKPEFLVLYEEHLSKKAYHAPILLAVLSFELWAKRYKLRS